MYRIGIYGMSSIVSTSMLLRIAEFWPSVCSLLLPSYFSKNYAGKIGASLATNIDSTSRIAPSSLLSILQQANYKTSNLSRNSKFNQ